MVLMKLSPSVTVAGALPLGAEQIVSNHLSQVAYSPPQSLLIGIEPP